MSSLTQQDEFIHPTGEESSWREAYYFDFFDPKTRLSGFGYSGVHPNQEIGDVIFALWKEDVLLARFARWDFNIPRDIGEERMGFGPLLFRPLVPFQTWEVLFDDGYCQLDLSFDAIHPPYSWADSETSLAETNSHHYEQHGQYTGTARIRGEEYKVNGVGVRDHAWGWGARAKMQSWLWSSAQFNPRFAFNTFQIAFVDGSNVLYGYLYRGDDNLFLERSRVEIQYAQRSNTPTAFRAELGTSNGEQISTSANVLNAFNISHQERNKQGFHYFCATEHVCEGQRGYGQSNFFWRKDAYRPEDWTVNQAKKE